MKYGKLKETAAKAMLSVVIGLPLIISYSLISDYVSKKLEQKEISNCIAKYESNSTLSSLLRTLTSNQDQRLSKLCEDASYVPDSVANQYLKEFPRNIPFAKRVRKYPIQNANRCVTVIPQYHWSKMPNSTNISNNCQKSIYRILKSLIETQNINQVYCEGQAERSTPDTVNQQYALKLLESDDLWSRPDTSNLQKLENILKDDECKRKDFLSQLQALNEKERAIFEKFKYAPGAAELLESEGSLNVMPAEEKELNYLANQINLAKIRCVLNKDYDFDRKIATYWDSLAMQSREFMALTLSSQEQYPLIIFGGGHNFEDNIVAWNTVYPNDKCSFIEVVPVGYKEKP